MFGLEGELLPSTDVPEGVGAAIAATNLATVISFMGDGFRSNPSVSQNIQLVKRGPQK